MTIKYKTFEIQVEENCYELYHIRQPRQTHRNKNKVVRVCLGYFNKLDSCIDQIVKVELSNRDEIVDLRKFIELYRGFKEDIVKALNI
jgi:hypothetical protein